LEWLGYNHNYFSETEGPAAIPPMRDIQQPQGLIRKKARNMDFLGFHFQREILWIGSTVRALGDYANKRRDGASPAHDAQALEVTGAHRRWPRRVRKARRSQ
jgi:hypothetical protein